MFTRRNENSLCGQNSAGLPQIYFVADAACRDFFSARSYLVGSVAAPETDRRRGASTTSRPLTTKNIGTLISKITFETLGVDVSPHLFRSAAASTAAVYGGNTPYLASALLNHTDPRVTEEHYNRASSVGASKIYAGITNTFLSD
jgi:integrase